MSGFIFRSASSAGAGVRRVGPLHTHTVTVSLRAAAAASQCGLLVTTFVHPMLQVSYQTRGFTMSSALNAYGTAGLMTKPVPYVLSLQRPGSPSAVPLPAKPDSILGFLLQKIASLLKLPAALDCVVLQLVYTDAGGEERRVTLDLRLAAKDALEKALGRPVNPKERLTVVVEVLPAKPIARLEYWLPGRSVDTPITKTITSEADFDKFIANRKLVSVDIKALNGLSGKKSANISADSTQVDIKRLNEAVEAMGKLNTCLILLDDAELTRNDVSNLKRNRDNAARAFAMESNKAIERDEQLRRTYGELKMLNDGLGVTFYDNNKDDFLEVDGLIVNTTVALINEAKTSLHENDVKVMSSKLQKLQSILDKPHLYSSEPPGIINKLAKLRCIAVASGKNHNPKVKETCQVENVHLLETDGSGYRCTLYL